MEFPRKRARYLYTGGQQKLADYVHDLKRDYFIVDYPANTELQTCVADSTWYPLAFDVGGVPASTFASYSSQVHFTVSGNTVTAHGACTVRARIQVAPGVADGGVNFRVGVLQNGLYAGGGYATFTGVLAISSMVHCPEVLLDVADGDTLEIGVYCDTAGKAIEFGPDIVFELEEIPCGYGAGCLMHEPAMCYCDYLGPNQDGGNCAIGNGVATTFSVDNLQQAGGASGINIVNGSVLKVDAVEQGSGAAGIVFGHSVMVDVIGEKTGGSGCMIDDCLVKDGHPRTDMWHGSCRGNVVTMTNVSTNYGWGTFTNNYAYGVTGTSTLDCSRAGTYRVKANLDLTSADTAGDTIRIAVGVSAGSLGSDYKDVVLPSATPVQVSFDRCFARTAGQDIYFVLANQTSSGHTLTIVYGEIFVERIGIA